LEVSHFQLPIRPRLTK